MISASSEAEPAGKGRVLAVDYGRKRIGLALSDEMCWIGRPLTTITRTNRRDDLRHLREIVRKHRVRQIVVGYPMRLDGRAGEMAEEAERFAKLIQKQLGVPVALVDERLSSWEAEESLAASGKKHKGEPDIDAVAAAVILKDYWERERQRKQTKK